MNKFLRPVLMALALMLVFNAFAVTETKAQQIVNEILKRMDAHNKALTSLQADVEMHKINPQIGTDDVYKGATKYVPLKGKDALVRIDWTSPETESLSVVNKKYILYRPRLKQAIVGNVNSGKSSGKGANNALAFMNMSKEQLKNNYAVRYIGKDTVGGFETWHLELTPKTAQNYKSAELWVDGNGMPLQAKVIENNNDSTTVLLSNLQKNASINTKVFIIDLPKGVTKIDG